MAMFKPKPMAKPVIAPKPVMGKPVMGKPVMPGIKPLPPGSIGMPGGPGGKTMYNTGPMPGNVEQNYRGIPGLVNATAPIGGPIGTTGFKKAPVGNIASRLTGGPAPSQPVMGNNINTTGFKNMSPATPQSSMKKGGAVGSASKRADGIATKGKTKGRMC
jgi:hypothetical protein